MPKRVNIPSVGLVDFPDTMSDAEITTAIQQNILKAAPAPAAEQQPQGIERGGNDLLDALKSAGSLFGAPKDDTEKYVASLTPGGLPIFRAVKGYYEGVKNTIGRAEQAASKGDNPGVLINSAAAGLPIAGPAISGLYEQSGKGDLAGDISVGASRALQVASMAPERGVIPNPLNATLKAAAKLPAKAAVATGKVLGEKIAPTMVNYAMGTPTKAMRYGKNPGAEVLDQGIAAKSMEELHGKISDALQAHSSELQKALTTPEAQGTRVNIQPAVNSVERALRQAYERNQPELIKPLETLKEKLLTNLVKTQKGPKRVNAGNKRAPMEVVELKRSVQESISWGTGAEYESALNKVKKQVQHELNSAVENALPEVAPLNAAVSNLIDAEAASGSRAAQVASGKHLFRSPEIAATFLGGPVAGVAAKAARTTAGLTYGARAMRGAGKMRVPNVNPRLSKPALSLTVRQAEEQRRKR